MLAALVLLAALGWGVNRTVQRELEAMLAAQLETILRADVIALKLWLEDQEQTAEAISKSPTFAQIIRDHLAASAGAASAEELSASSALRELRRRLGHLGQTLGYGDFLVFDPSGRVVGGLHDCNLGSRQLAQREFLSRALAGEVVVSRPFLDAVPCPEGIPSEGPTQFAASPVHDADGQVVGVLGLRLDPRQFTAILQAAYSGTSGETYAFDGDGLFLSHSRFDPQLTELGLVEAGEQGRSILHVQARDPGGDMTCGHRPDVAIRALPLTRGVAAAVSGRSGSDVEGYRDYRGIAVVGAWTWLPEHGFGVITEVDRSEAFRPLLVLRIALGVLLGLLTLVTVSGVVAYGMMSRLRRKMGRAEQRLQRLGQYTLVERIGAGGMGEVFLARHAMLRRPTAVKLLRPDRSDPKALARFEREVQLSSRLTHANTIRIYDYGRTPEGTFYYAMEYLHGVALDDFVAQEGPLPAGRVIHILVQVLGSLDEAHSAGLIHRDIKPANVMLCVQGGTYDVVKVLDFGLVKDLDRKESVALSAADAVAGTPAYISPEGIQHPAQVDARSDLYSVGGLAYYLLTGSSPFPGNSAMQAFVDHLETAPTPPSERLGRPIDADLEALVLQCLAKDPAERPQAAYPLLQALEQCEAAGSWGRCRARRWWGDNQERLEEAQLFRAVTPPDGQGPKVSFAVDLDQRMHSDRLAVR